MATRNAYRSQMDIVVAAQDAPAEVLRKAAYRCDGTNDEDDIQAAVADVASKGGMVTLSEGTFNIGEPASITNGTIVNMSANVYVRGAGRGASILKFTTGRNISGDRYMFRWPGDTDSGIQNSGVYDLSIVCVEDGDHGLGLTGCAHIVAARLAITHDGTETSTDEGIQIAGGNGGVEYVLFDDILISGFDIGMEWRAGGNYARFITARGVKADANLTAGIQLLRVSEGNAPEYNDLIGCWTNNQSAAGADGLILDGARYTTVIGGGASGNVGDGLICDSTNAQGLANSITGFKSTANGASGFVIEDTDTRIISCTAIDNTNSNFRAPLAAGGDNWFQNNVSLGVDATPTNGFKEQNNPSNNVYIGNYSEGCTNDWALGTNYSTISNSMNRGTGAPVP